MFLVVDDVTWWLSWISDDVIRWRWTYSSLSICCCLWDCCCCCLRLCCGCCLCVCCCCCCCCCARGYWCGCSGCCCCLNCCCSCWDSPTNSSAPMVKLACSLVWSWNQVEIINITLDRQTHIFLILNLCNLLYKYRRFSCRCRVGHNCSFTRRN